ncbi:MAG: SatD family protein [Nocardioides sp.]
MAEGQHGASATLLGDLVSSRSTDRVAVHGRLVDVLAEVSTAVPTVSPLRVTAGDEFQGRFATVGAALQASLRLRLALLPEYDARHGVGWGAVALLQADPLVEDGPGWWAARAAIDQVRAGEGRAALREVRTAYVRAAGEATGPDEAAVAAALLGRDQLLARLDERALSVLAGLLAGRTQRELAADLGISESAVSQRVRKDGLGVLVAIDDRMGWVR